MVVVWTPHAIDDLATIWEYYHALNIEAAKKILHAIREAALRLADYPEMAPIDPFLTEFAPAYRSLVIRRIYKMVYKIENEELYIMEIFDCRQNPATLKTRIKRR